MCSPGAYRRLARVQRAVCAPTGARVSDSGAWRTERIARIGESAIAEGAGASTGRYAQRPRHWLAIAMPVSAGAKLTPTSSTEN